MFKNNYPLHALSKITSNLSFFSSANPHLFLGYHSPCVHQKTLLDNNKIIVYSLDFKGWILIDRCGKQFGTVLNFLRDGSAPLPQNETELKEVLAEAKYYLIEELVAQCEGLLAKKKEQHDPICRVPLITSTKEERLLASTANKVSNNLYAC